MNVSWQDLGRKLAALGLPVLGAQLGGPLGAVVGKQIAERIGAKDAEPDVVEQALMSGDRETMMQIYKLEVEREAAQTAAALESQRIAAADVQAARAAQVPGDWWPKIIDACVFAFVAVLVYGLLFIEIPATNRSDLSIVLGVIIGAFGAVMTFHRGSSSGSKAAGATLANELAKKP